jgi:Ca-activated chloride channel family protein
MKVRSFVSWAALGMVATTACAMVIPVSSTSATLRPAIAPDIASPDRTPSHFNAGDALAVDARLGHASIARGSDGSTFLAASVTANESTREAPPLSLAIVVDRSGSMAGKKLSDALAGAVGTVEHMRTGDTVSVVAFDGSASVVVPPTTVSESTRADVERRIRTIHVAGDTCISCGLEMAMHQLDASGGAGRDGVSRILLLSDGEATSGIKDAASLASMAARMGDRGVTVSTIGLGVDYDERLMSAVASSANGRHYFVADTSNLDAVFEGEFKSLEASVAAEAELDIDLAPGVEIERVFDRRFRREGSHVVVPFGSFSAKDEKTVLLELHVPASLEGIENVAKLSLTYRDLARGGPASAVGELALEVRSDGDEQKELDPFVAARVERSGTVAALEQANSLFAQGKGDEARATLAQQKARVESDETLSADMPAPAKPRGRGLSADFDDQKDALARAESAIEAKPSASGAPAAAPAPQSTQGKGAVKAAQKSASDLAF